MDRPRIVTREELETLPEGLYCLPDSDEGMWHLARVTDRRLKPAIPEHIEQFVRQDGLIVALAWHMEFPEGWVRLLEKCHTEEVAPGHFRRVLDEYVPVEYPAGNGPWLP